MRKLILFRKVTKKHQIFIITLIFYHKVVVKNIITWQIFVELCKHRFVMQTLLNSQIQRNVATPLYPSEAVYTVQCTVRTLKRVRSLSVSRGSLPLWWICCWSMILHTASTQYRKCETNIPREGTARLQSNSYIHASVSDLYTPLIGLLQDNKWIKRGNIYCRCSQTHACGNCDWGCAIPLLGIHKSKFLCSASMYFSGGQATNFVDVGRDRGGGGGGPWKKKMEGTVKFKKKKKKKKKKN